MFILDTDKLFEVTHEDREKAKTYTGYKIKNYMKDNWRQIGTIILIVMIWYYFNYVDTFFCNNFTTKIVQSGGGPSSYARSVQARAGANWGKAAKGKIGAKADAAGKAISDAPGRAAAYAQRKVDSFKVLSGAIYQIIFQVAIFVMTLIIFGPALTLFIIMIVCFAVLKQKVRFVKGL